MATLNSILISQNVQRDNENKMEEEMRHEQVIKDIRSMSGSVFMSICLSHPVTSDPLQVFFRCF